MLKKLIIIILLVALLLLFITGIYTDADPALNNIHIKNSYNTWSVDEMYNTMIYLCQEEYGTIDIEKVLNRSTFSLYIEWWLHNIGYYITLPFCFSEKVLALNLRFKNVDLEEASA